MPGTVSIACGTCKKPNEVKIHCDCGTCIELNSSGNKSYSFIHTPKRDVVSQPTDVSNNVMNLIDNCKQDDVRFNGVLMLYKFRKLIHTTRTSFFDNIDSLPYIIPFVQKEFLSKIKEIHCNDNTVSKNNTYHCKEVISSLIAHLILNENVKLHTDDNSVHFATSYNSVRYDIFISYHLNDFSKDEFNVFMKRL
jgi:hypothetical protein